MLIDWLHLADQYIQVLKIKTRTKFDTERKIQSNQFFLPLFSFSSSTSDGPKKTYDGLGIFLFFFLRVNKQRMDVLYVRPRGANDKVRSPTTTIYAANGVTNRGANCRRNERRWTYPLSATQPASGCETEHYVSNV